MLFLLAAGSASAQWYNGADALNVRYEGQCVDHNGKMYVFSGFTNGFQVESTNEVYDPTTNTWAHFPSMPTPCTHTGVALVNNNEVWVVGGRLVNNTQVAVTRIYNIATQSWSLGPSLPEVRAGGGLALVNNKLYWISGFGTSGLIDEPEVFMLDLANQGAGWSVVSNCPSPRNHFGTAVLNDKIYMVGGQTEHDNSAHDVTEVTVYDPATNTWSTAASLPSVNSHIEPGTFVHNGKIICVGGEFLANAVMEYDPATNTWTQTDTFPVSRLAPAARILDGKFIISHGGDGVTPTKATYLKNIGGASNNPPVLAGIGNQSNPEGSAVSLQTSATDPDGDNLTFSATGLPAGLAINAATGLVSGTLTAAAGTYSVTITVTDDGSPALSDSETFDWEITSTGGGAPGTPIYRVNAGGIDLADTPIGWELDKETTPSQYVNSNQSNNTTGWDGGWTGTNTTGAPDLIFTTDRWDGPWGDEMKWDFPVTNGTYQVNLYFCEYKQQYSTAGTRFFDVSIEGQLVLNDYDIIVDVGFNVAAKKSFAVTVTDGNIDIDLNRVVGGENPKINGIEILSAEANTAPVIAAIADQANQQGETVSLTATATDADGDTLSFSATGLPAGLAMNAATGEISGTITATGGVYAVSVIVSDDGMPALSDTASFNWTITVPNQAPVIDPIADQTTEEGETVSLMLTATDPDGDNLSWSATGLPAGLAINATTGEISGTLTATADTFAVSVIATDDGTPNEADTAAFNWIVTPPVNDPPVLAAIGNQSSTEGETVSLPISATDPENDLLTFSATGLPAGLGISPTTGEISGTLTAALGTYTVTVTVTDNGTPNLSDSETFDWAVNPPNQPPVLATMLDQLSEEGATVSVFASATDPDGDNLSFAATGLPAGLSINPTTGEISGTLTATAGTYTVSVTVTDDGEGNLTDTQSFNWVITTPPVAGAVLFRVNAGGSEIPTPSVAWGLDKQGTPSPYLVPGNNQTTGWYGGFTVAGGVNNTSAPDSLFGEYRLDASWSPDPGIKYAFPLDNGNYEVKLFFAEYQNDVPGSRFFDVLLENVLVMDDYDIVATDGFNVAVEKTFQAEVSDGTLNLVLQRVPGGGYPLLSGIQISAIGTSNTPPVLAAIADQNNYQGEAVSLMLVATDADSNALSWSASGLPPGLSINPTTGEISGTVDPQAATGAYSVSVQVIDDGVPAANDIENFSWTITLPPNLPPVIDPIADQNHEQGQSVSLSLTATDPEGDNFTFAASGLPAGLSINTTTGEISGTITAAPAVYAVTITATDDGNPVATGSLSFNWTVTLPNQAPVIDPIADMLSEEGETVSFTPVASDFENGTLSWAASGLPAGLSIDMATGEISGTITASADTFQVNLTVTDDGSPNLSDTATFNWIVIVPPPNQAPVITAIADQQNYQGEAISLQVNATDPDGDNIAFSATGLPAGLTINTTTGLISGSISATPDTFSVVVIATDDGTPLIEADTASFNWIVTPPPPNQAPVIDPVADQSVTEGHSFSLTVKATDAEGHQISMAAANLPPGLSISPLTDTTFSIAGTVQAAAAGDYAVTLTATDDGTPPQSDTASFTLTVLPNTPPIVQGILDQLNQQADAASLQVVATDAEDVLAYSASGLPAGLAINASTGLISGTLTATAGVYPVSVQVSDGINAAVSVSFNWYVNAPPVAGDVLFRVNAGGSEIPTPSLAWGLDKQGTPSPYLLPGNNQTTGWYGGFTVAGGVNNTIAPDSLFGEYRLDASWSPDPGIKYAFPLDNGNYEVKLFFAEYQNDVPGSRFFDVLLENVLVMDDYDIVATDGFNVAVEKTFQTEVADGTLNLVLQRVPGGGYPLLSGLQIASIGSNNAPPHVSPLADQSTQQTLPVSLQVVAADPDSNNLSFNAIGLPAGLSIGATTGLISGTLTADTGVYSVSIQVIDDGTPVADSLISFNWTVLPPPNSPPSLSPIADQTHFEGETVSVSVAASDPDGDNLSFSASGLPAGISINPLTGEMSGTLTALEGSYAVTVTVTDDGAGNLSASQSFSWTIYEVNIAPVLDPIADQTHEDGQSVSVVATATDANSDQLSYTATGLPGGISINPSTGEMSGTLSAAYTTYTVNVMVVDDGVPALSDTTTFNWTVVEPPNIPPVLDPIADRTDEQGEIVSQLVSASDPDGDNLSFSANNLPPGISINPATGEMSGTLTGSPAVYVVELIATDDGTPQIAADTVSFSWNVIAPVNDPPVLAHIADQVHTEGDTLSVALSATDPEGDQLTFSAMGLPAGLVIDANTGTIYGRLTAAADTFSVTVTVTDDGSPNESDSQTFSWIILLPNQPPVITPIGDQNHYMFESVALQITATDPEGDNISFSATGLPAGLSINFTSGMISGTISDTADTYPVMIVATDDGSPQESDTAYFNWIVDVPPNNAPALSAISDRSDEAGNTVSQSVSASDPDGDQLTFSASGLPDGISINPTTGEMTGTIVAMAGDYAVTVTVTDDGIPNLSHSQNFTWTVTPYINEQPVLAGIPDQESEEGEPISLYASASDPDGDNLFFEASGLPAGLSMNPLTAEMSGVINAAAGDYSVQVIVWDDGTPALSDTASFIWTVNPQTPPASGDPVYRVNAGGMAVPQMPLIWEEDKQSNPVSYFAGTNNQTTGWDFGFMGTNNTGAPDTLFGTIRKDAPWDPSPTFGYDFPLTTGYYEVRLYFAETNGAAPGARLMDVSIENALVLDNYDIAADVGQNVAVKKTFIVHVTDGNLDLDFTSAGGTEKALVNGIEIRIAGNEAPQFAISNQVHEEFETVSVPVNAIDPEGHALVYHASGLPDGLGIDSLSGVMSGTIVADTGDYVVTVTVTDDGQPVGMTTKTFTWTVLPTPQPNHEPVLTINDQTHEEGQSVSVTVLAADPDGDQLTFAATGLPAGLSLNPNTGVISGTITSPAATYPVTISVTDDGTPNLTTSRNINWTVVVPPPNHAPVITPIADQSFMIGLTVSVPVTATDQDGDSLVFSATGLPAGISIDPQTGTMSGTITATPGVYAVTVTVTDNGSPVMSDTDQFNWTVEQSHVAACLTIHETGSNLEFASNFDTGSTKIYNRAPNGEKIVRVRFDIRNMMHQDFVFDDGTALGGAMGTPGHKIPTQDGGDAVGYVPNSHTYMFPHHPFPILYPDSTEAYQGFELTFDPNIDGGFEAGETFVFSYDSDPTSISYVTDNNGPGAAGKTCGMEMSGTVVTIEWDNGTVLSREIWRMPSVEFGGQVYISENYLEAPTIDVPALPQDSMRVFSPNHTVRVTGTPGYAVSLMVAEGAHYAIGPNVPLHGFDPDYFETNNIIALSVLTNYTIGPRGYVDIPITLIRQDETDSLAGRFILRAVIRDPNGCNDPTTPCNNGCTSGLSNKIILHYDPLGGNHRPFIEPVANQTNEVGEQIELPIRAFDPEAGTLTCSATGLPDGLSIDPATGLISGLITAAPGDYHVFVTVTDNGSPAADTTRHFDWEVVPSTNPNPVLATIGDQTSEEGETVSLTVSASDPNGNNLSFSATGLPAGLAIDSLSGEISGVVTAAPGAYTVTVTVTDDGTPVKTDSETFTWTIIEATNPAPVITQIPDQTSEEGETVSVPVTANDPNGNTLSYTATGLPAGIGINPTTGTMSGVVSAAPGVYTVVVTVTDDGTPFKFDTDTLSWTIVPATNPAPVLAGIPDQTSEPGETVSLTVSATDPNGNNLSFSATGLPAGLAIDSLSGEISGVITAAPGSYAVTVTVTDDGNPFKFDTQTFTWTITEITNPAPVLAAIPDQNSEQGETVSLTASATDANGNTLSYSATGLPAGLSMNTATGEMSGTITDTAGTYAVTVIVVDDGSPYKSDTATFNWTVIIPPNEAPVLTALPDRSDPQTSTVSLQIVATDPDGDTLSYAVTGLPDGLSVNDSTGLISGTITGLQGIYPVQVIVTDNGNPPLSDTTTFNWTVTSPPNQPPVLTDTTDQQHVAGASVAFQMVATDPDGNNLSFVAANLPGGLAIDTASGLISGTITGVQGIYPVQVIVTDDGVPPLSDTTSFNWTVTAPPNQPPVLDSIAAQLNDPGDTVNVTIVHATDPEGDAISFSAMNLPTGLSIDANSGAISGVIDMGLAAGDYSVQVIATDDGIPIESDTVSFIWTINPLPNQPPVLAAVSDQVNTQGDTVSVTVSATDPESDAMVFNAVNLPAGLSIGGMSGEISGVITADTGVYTVSVVVTDNGTPAESDTTYFQWTVNAPANQPPVLAAIADQTHEEGATVSLQVSATDPENGTLTYSATGLPAGLGIDSGSGLISGTLTASADTFAVSVVVTDDGTPALGDTASFTWYIIVPVNQPPIMDTIADQSHEKGQTVSLQVVASDPDSNNLSYSAVGLPTGLSIHATTGLISGTITASAATYTVHVTVTDDGSPSESVMDSFFWTVTDSMANQAPVITPIADQTNVQSDTVSLQVQATDPEGHTLFYSASGLPSGLSINPVTGLISGVISASANTYTVTITVLDFGTPSASSTAVFNWTVTEPSGRRAGPGRFLPVPTIFPNPVDDEFTLVIPYTENELYTIRITDMYGKVVYQAEEVESDYLRIYAGNLPEGVYLLHIKGNTQQYKAIRIMKK